MIQNRMSEKKREIDELQVLLGDITEELNLEKQKNIEMMKELATTSAQKDSEHGRATSLESNLTSNNRKIVSLQDSLADKQQEIREMLEKFQELSHKLDIEQNRSQDLLDELNDTHSKHDNEYNRANSLEQDVQSKHNQISGLLNQLNDIAYNYEQEREKSNELEKNLFKVMSKLDEKENILDQILSDNQVTKEEFGTLKREIDRIREERDALARELQTSRDNQISSEDSENLQKEINRIKQEKDALAREKEKLAKKNEQQIKLLLQQQDIVQKLSGDIQSQQEAMKQIERNQHLIKEEAASTRQTRKKQIESPAPVTSKPKDVEQNKEITAAESHTVRQGESLSTISVYYYGTPNRWIDIYNANTHVLQNKNDPIMPGMNLTIPK
jgi:chromosome segregation ATPase